MKIKSISITLEIMDKETVEAYTEVDDALIYEDLLTGTLMGKTSLVKIRRNEKCQENVNYQDSEIRAAEATGARF
jgi:hypothetical protein